MNTRLHLTTWISRESKQRFADMAEAQGLSESALLRRLIEAYLPVTPDLGDPAPALLEPVSATGRISVRLRNDDLLLLRERATARELPTSTYVSYLVRAHLRAQVPLPTAELDELKRSVAELGAIGRNINQIARAVNQQQWPAGPNRGDLLAILRALTALRDHTKALINANLASWDSGHAKKSS
jgi:Bacterial mobilisation protein (MobC)